MKKTKSKVKVRKRWKINPKTKIKQSAKHYCRPKEKKKVKKVINNDYK